MLLRPILQPKPPILTSNTTVRTEHPKLMKYVHDYAHVKVKIHTYVKSKKNPLNSYNLTCSLYAYVHDGTTFQSSPRQTTAKQQGRGIGTGPAENILK